MQMPYRTIVSAFMLTTACTLSPETRLRHEVVGEIYWDAAKECETRAIKIDRVSIDGDLTVAVDSGQTGGVPQLIECYWQGIQRRVEARRRAGLPVPESLNLKPGVDVDQDR